MPENAAAMLAPFVSQTGGGAPLAQPQRSPVAPGNTAPATVAPDSQGLKMRGALKVHLGMQALTQAAGSLPDDQRAAVMKALGILSPIFGLPSGDLSRAEVKALGESAPAMTTPQPQQAQAIQQKLKSMGLGGGAAAPQPAPQPEPAQPAA